MTKLRNNDYIQDSAAVHKARMQHSHFKDLNDLFLQNEQSAKATLKYFKFNYGTIKLGDKEK